MLRQLSGGTLAIPKGGGLSPAKHCLRPCAQGQGQQPEHGLIGTPALPPREQSRGPAVTLHHKPYVPARHLIFAISGGELFLITGHGQHVLLRPFPDRCCCSVPEMTVCC